MSKKRRYKQSDLGKGLDAGQIAGLVLVWGVVAAAAGMYANSLLQDAAGSSFRSENENNIEQVESTEPKTYEEFQAIVKASSEEWDFNNVPMSIEEHAEIFNNSAEPSLDIMLLEESEDPFNQDNFGLNNPNFDYSDNKLLITPER